MKCIRTRRTRKYLVARPLKANSMLPSLPYYGTAQSNRDRRRAIAYFGNASSRQPIDALRRAAEQHRLLGCRRSSCQALESVPQDRIARAGVVWRKLLSNIERFTPNAAMHVSIRACRQSRARSRRAVSRAQKPDAGRVTTMITWRGTRGRESRRSPQAGLVRLRELRGRGYPGGYM
jgi:hypothetical protein